MKNIHVLKTDKKTRLFTSDSELILAGYPATTFKTGKNIYITSDEEIKDGDWYFDGTDLVHKKTKYNDALVDGNKNAKKIILTTDQDLIKDGVQAIDDEFLEWFVKNPNCEEVEVIKTFEDYTIVGGKSDEIYYKIIIPKEEQKQHLIEMMKADEELGLYEENTKCYCGHTTYCDCIPLEVKIDILDFNQIVKEPKQETLEEAAQKKYPVKNTGTLLERFGLNYVANQKFIEGAKWEQERLCNSQVIQRIRASKSDAEARRIIRTI